MYKTIKRFNKNNDGFIVSCLLCYFVYTVYIKVSVKWLMVKNREYMHNLNIHFGKYLISEDNWCGYCIYCASLLQMSGFIFMISKRVVTGETLLTDCSV